MLAQGPARCILPVGSWLRVRRGPGYTSGVPMARRWIQALVVAFMLVTITGVASAALAAVTATEDACADSGACPAGEDEDCPPVCRVCSCAAFPVPVERPQLEGAEVIQTEVTTPYVRRHIPAAPVRGIFHPPRFPA